MAKARVATGLVAGCLLLWGAAPAQAQPSVAQMLGLHPKQPGVGYSTPNSQEQDACKVEAVKGNGRGAGWLLRDSQGRPVRRFYNTRFTSRTDGTKMDVWSYYKDGVEVYREIDSNFDGVADQFRWLNTGGMKWGLDVNQDGKIDAWRAISVEEVSQEILQAVAGNDYARLQALFISDAEIKSLEMPAADAARIREQQKQAPAKFRATVAKAGLSGNVTWLHVETGPPQCLPADVAGTKQELIKHARCTILYEANGKHDWLQTGELIQVGLAWRITDAPATGQDAGGEVVGSAGGQSIAMTKELQPLLDQLRELDKSPPAQPDSPGPNPAIVRYHLERAALLEQVANKVKAEDREQWTRQIADSLSAAAQASPASDKAAYQRLARLEDETVKSSPSTNLAAYVTFREMQADYAVKLTGAGQDFAKVQAQWIERLAKFVETYPQADDTPDALLQLGMVSEFIGKETEAKNWYDQLVKNFSSHALATKAKGARARLEVEGKPIELAGPTLDGSAFDIARLRGKVVVVYYWASWNNQCAADFAKLKQLQATHGGKGLEVVCVNLDATPAEATAFLQKNPGPATHLYQPGGLESPLALQYGVMVLPNMFLVNKEGKVTSRTVQMGSLEDEVKKLLN
jgi:thiol-disulfide isomerase/thioredoxin